MKIYFILVTSIIVNALLFITLYIVLYRKDSTSLLSRYMSYNNNLINLLEVIITNKDDLYRLLQGKKVVIYGCGKIGILLYKLLEQNANLMCFLDRNIINKKIEGISVYKKGRIELDSDCAIIISVLYNESQMIAKELEQIYPQVKIYTIGDLESLARE